MTTPDPEQVWRVDPHQYDTNPDYRATVHSFVAEYLPHVIAGTAEIWTYPDDTHHLVARTFLSDDGRTIYSPARSTSTRIPDTAHP